MGKGQFSSFLKPIQIIIFASIFVAVIALFLNFEIGLREQEADFSSDKQVISSYQPIASCLSVDSTESPANFLLNKSKLEKYDRELKDSQLPCAFLPDIGYNLTVEPSYLQSLTAPEPESGAHILFVLDTSGSFDGDEIETICKAKRKINEEDSGMEIDVKGMHGNDGCTETVSENPIDSLEDWAGGILWAVRKFDWDEDREKILVYGGDECPAGADEPPTNFGGKCPDYSHEKKDEAIRALQNEGSDIESIGIWGTQSGQEEIAAMMTEIAETTGGEAFHFHDTIDRADEWILEIGGGKQAYAGGENTCTLPKVEKFDGSVDLVFTADTSSSFEENWNNICRKAKEAKKEFDSKGVNASVSIYAQGNPENPSTGQGDPATIDGSGYDHRSGQRHVPGCLDAEFNDAEDLKGKGITGWSNKMPDFNESRDYGYEAWGTSAHWILEKHEWREDTDMRKLVVLGDHLPTGGLEDQEAFYENSSSELENETEIVENLTGLANNLNVEIDTFSGEMEYDSSVMQKPFDENDAEILLRKASEDTGGESRDISELGRVEEEISETFRRVEGGNSDAGFCSDMHYSFGQQDNVDSGSKRTISYPVNVRQSSVRATGRMDIEVRRDELSDLYGKVGRVIRNGRERNERSSATFRFSTDGRIVSKNDHRVIQEVEEDYRLLNDDGQPMVEVSDKLIIGINGEKVGEFEKEENEESVVADFSSSNFFKAYEGAYFQHIAVNRDEETGMKLEGIQLECSGCPGNPKQEIVGEIDESKGSEEYEERSGVGVFEFNSTRIEVGRTRSEKRPAICLQKQGEEACSSFDVDEISEIELSPGSYLLRVDYFPNQDRVVIND